MIHRTLLRSRLFWSGAAAYVSLWAASCGDSVTEDGDTGDKDGLVTNECGTYDPDNDMHAIGPVDPTAEGLVDACDEVCAKLATIQGCSTDLTECRDDCRLTACQWCPGNFEPFVRCRGEFFDAADCTCVDGKAECEVPADCEDEQGLQYACGG